MRFNSLVERNNVCFGRGWDPFRPKSQIRTKNYTVPHYAYPSNARPRKHFPFLCSLHSTGKAKEFLFPALFIHASIYCWLVSSFHRAWRKLFFPCCGKIIASQNVSLHLIFSVKDSGHYKTDTLQPQSFR